MGGNRRKWNFLKLIKMIIVTSVSDGSVFAKNAGFQLFIGQPSEFPLIQVKKRHLVIFIAPWSHHGHN